MLQNCIFRTEDYDLYVCSVLQRERERESELLQNCIFRTEDYDLRLFSLAERERGGGGEGRERQRDRESLSTSQCHLRKMETKVAAAAQD